MSISGSQEAKTAVLNSSPDAGEANAETVQLDAQEDREIIGFAISGVLDGSDAAPNVARIEAKLFVGIDNMPQQGERGNDLEQDNLSWHYRARFSETEDDVNGDGLASEANVGEWYGHGSGIEWNEDATLSLTVVNFATANNSLLATVYYREL